MARYGSGKDTTSGYKRIDVRFLQKRGFLVPGRWFTLSWKRSGVNKGWIQGRTTNEAVILSYKHRRGEMEEWKSEEYPVSISYSPCNYGGERPWLHCPARGCGRRVAILYGGAIFACRHCHQLGYESQRERDYERRLSRAQAIHERLGGTGCVADEFPEKPKGMHWSTYRRLSRQYDYFDRMSAVGAARRFGLFADLL
jgi:hypothetical protein